MKTRGGWQAVLVGGLILGTAAFARAHRRPLPESSPWREQGAGVGGARLVRYFQELPQRRAGEKAEAFAERLQEGLERFKKKVADHYDETSLLRLLDCTRAETRRAAVVALGLTGTIRVNGPLAGMLHDEDGRVRRYTADALWSLWFRADTPENNRELRRLMALTASKEKGEAARALAGLGVLIQKAPRFAEAYNQRAILLYRQGEYRKAIADCEKVLKLNPYHFGAASGMGQAYMKLRDPRGALKAFRIAYHINPNMEDVGQLLRLLERLLGDEGKKE